METQGLLGFIVVRRQLAGRFIGINAQPKERERERETKKNLKYFYEFPNMICIYCSVFVKNTSACFLGVRE